MERFEGNNHVEGLSVQQICASIPFLRITRLIQKDTSRLEDRIQPSLRYLVLTGREREHGLIELCHHLFRRIHAQAVLKTDRLLEDERERANSAPEVLMVKTEERTHHDRIRGLDPLFAFYAFRYLLGTEIVNALSLDEFGSDVVKEGGRWSVHRIWE